MSNINPNVSRSLIDFDEKYYAIRFKIPTVGGTGKTLERLISVPGNHLFIARLDHQQATYVKLGPDTNPWIRVLRGDVITRNFTRFKIRIADFTGKWPVSTGRQASGLFYVSNGPLIVRRHMKSGVFPLCFAKSKIQVPSGLNSLAALMFGGTAHFQPMTVGAYGGTLVITNTGTVNVYLDFNGTQGPPGAGPNINWFVILPGATFTMDLGAVLAWNSNDNVPQVSADAGQTGEIAVLVDAESDYDFNPNDNALQNENDNFSIEG
jgi:hypothetical protein